MKKSILSGAVLALAVVGLAACTGEAKASGVTIYGQVEASVGTDSSKNAADDSFIGFAVTESLNEAGDSAFAKIEMGVDSDASSNADQITVRESYVGVNMSGITGQVGKMKNLRKTMVNGVDAFQGDSSFSVDGAARTADVAMVKGEFAGVTVAASTVLNGTANADEVGETRELGASVEVQGITLSAVQSKAGTADAVMTYAAGAEVAGINLAVAHEPDATNSTTTVVGEMDFGANTVRVGNSFVTDGDNTMVAEVAHNFSKSTSAFVNYGKTENADSTTSVGIAMTF
jgi:hypothetical protein